MSPEIFDTMLDFHRRLVLLESEINELMLEAESLMEDEECDKTDIAYMVSRLGYCLYLSDLSSDLPEIFKDN